MKQNVLQVEDLSVEFRGEGKILDDVSFSLDRGQTLGIVGESGCGKSMTALSLMRLLPSSALRVTEGRIRLNGEDILTASNDRMREIRGSGLAMVFQDPMTSLNPLFTVGDQIAESITKNRLISRADAMSEVTELLKMVGIPDPKSHLGQYPHQLSGGKRQRVMIAIALAGNPDVLVADEPTTALDVTVQAQIFDVLRERQRATGTAIILITHDLGAVAEMADRVVVMYAGKVVEEGTVVEILNTPMHPYSRALISCIPYLSEETFDEWPVLPVIKGVVPSLAERQDGCAFAPRCLQADGKCLESAPPFTEAGNHRWACWHSQKDDLR